MKFIFSSDEGFLHNRSRYLRGGLLRNHHQVRVLRSFEKIPGADYWLHGVSPHDGVYFSEPLICGLRKFTGSLIFYQNDDTLNFAIHKIPPDLHERARLFLRNVWPAASSAIHESIGGKTGLINPLLNPVRSSPGLPLKSRPHRISFFGSGTGVNVNNRIAVLQLLKTNGIAFTGGLFVRDGIALPPAELIVPRLSPAKHLRVLEKSRMSVVLHGHNPLTYRLFECLSRQCLVLAQDLSGITFADCGLTAGTHYVSIRADFSDLVEKIRYYENHLDDAQCIASAGFDHFKRNFAFSGVNLPQPLYKNIISTWKNLSLPRGSITPFSLAARWLLPVIHSV